MLELKILANDLAARKPGSPDVVLYGPRGNGKTTLINYFQKRIWEASKIRSIVVDPTEIPTPNEVYEILLQKPIRRGKTVTTLGELKAGFLGTGASASRASARSSEATLTETRRRCIKRMVRRPTLLMVDEAHEIPRESLHEITTLTEASNRGDTNFRFVLAGTPGLPDHLRNVGPTYLNRASFLRVDRLDVESTKAALFGPMEISGLSISLTAPMRVRLTEQTQCYPHFVQSIGHAIWSVLESEGSDTVDDEIVAKAEPLWKRRVNTMYEGRYQELYKRDLFPFAIAIAGEYERVGKLYASKSIDVDEIQTIIQTVDGDVRPNTILTELRALGYVWPGKNGYLYEAGIPSLLSYMLEIKRARDEKIHSNQRDDDFD